MLTSLEAEGEWVLTHRDEITAKIVQDCRKLGDNSAAAVSLNFF